MFIVEHCSTSATNCHPKLVDKLISTVALSKHTPLHQLFHDYALHEKGYITVYIYRDYVDDAVVSIAVAL